MTQTKITKLEKRIANLERQLGLTKQSENYMRESRDEAAEDKNTLRNQVNHFINENTKQGQEIALVRDENIILRQRLSQAIGWMNAKSGRNYTDDGMGLAMDAVSPDDGDYCG